jgi:FKBP-type peptidyl-prolyl cis-trans isomerase FklB
MKIKKSISKIVSPVILLGIIVSSCNVVPIDEPDKVMPQNSIDSISYIIGWDYGNGIKDQEIGSNPIMIYKGLADALNEKGIFSDSVREQLIADFQLVLEAKEEERFQEMLLVNKAEGRQFLENNKRQEGVTELPNGLQYKINKIGKGVRPLASDSVIIHYRAMYIDRTTFDMSYERGPTGIRLNHVVQGLSEGIQMMKEGAIFEFYIPPALAYGDENYMDMIPAGSTTIYLVELIKVHN